MSAPTEPKFYLMLGGLYLDWRGLEFTDKEECAWLGTAKHLGEFRPRHDLATRKGIRVVAAPSPSLERVS